jgi:hypothetical protein
MESGTTAIPASRIDGHGTGDAVASRADRSSLREVTPSLGKVR